ncbi:MAG: helix-turn-helix domain-containing protein [Archangium sp.]|nr:helix-turn-helix domain-containing protein [Archangium sp.]
MNRRAARPARGVVHGVASGPVTHARTAPAEALAGVIEHFWSVAWDLRGLPPLLVQTLPHPSVHVIVEGHKHEVTGVATRRFSRTLEGKGRVFGIKFRPAMFHAVLGAPVSTLADRVVPLGTVFGRAGARWAEDLSADAEPIALAERFLLERVTDVDPLARAVRDLVERAALDRTWVKVEQLAAASGFTLRMLQRHFRTYVGASPKWVLQRYRLHEANERLKANPKLELADLAAELGYVDQPHFVRDFKALLGVTPGAYAKTVAAGRA